MVLEVEVPSAKRAREILIDVDQLLRLFTLTSWLMYWFGSVVAVGSWFCISVTSSVRKSLADMVADELLVPLVLLVPAAFAVELDMGFGEAPERACAAVID